MLKLLWKFCELHEGREYRLLLIGLCGVTTVISLYAPHLQAEMAMISMFTNVIWIYGK